MNRRHLLTGGVAAGALAVGVAWGWRQKRTPNINEANTDANAIWTQSFDSPSGEPINMSRFKGSPLLINFWATWCPPCIKEMPLLDAFYQQHQTHGWQVLGLAVDSPTPVKEFLAKQPMHFPIGQAGLTGVDLSRSLGNTHGSLPFTVAFNAQGKIVFRKLGELNDADLASMLGSA
jgi:thiol-disulfide isomerase/thioredoxin